MSNSTNTSQLYEVGNRRFFAASLNPNGTFGTKEYHEGLMEVNIEFTSEVTDLSADDDPSFVRLSSPLMGEGTVKFAVLPFAVYAKFFDVSVDANGAVVIKSTAKTKELAFGFYSSVGDGSESMFTMYRAVFALPALATISFDGTAIRDLTLNVKVYPYRYTAANNQPDTVTYTILNSAMNTAIWQRVQDIIYVPDMTVPPA
ncbi:MAG: hypothetical protein FWE03_00360 [Firmicutes bacterium]|nr:hypothetical protein [Bacillota bacterium]